MKVRLIDADKVLLKLKEEIIGNEPMRDSETDGSDTTYDTVVDIINNTPTAYNVDKVVEGIEKEIKDEQMNLANMGDEITDEAYQIAYMYLSKCIEIVNRGGVDERI